MSVGETVELMGILLVDKMAEKMVVYLVANLVVDLVAN
jgi:hypothetical protein